MDRCPWCFINETEIKYHDEKWGISVYDDQMQFEYLMLDVMQCNLSWNTFIKQREIFNDCFDCFDYNKIAAYSELDIEQIMNTPCVISSRRKI